MPKIPVIQFGGMRPPQVTGPGSELSRRMGEALSDAMGDEPLRVDMVLEVLAVWVAALITIHPSTYQYLLQHFAETLAANGMGETLQ